VPSPALNAYLAQLSDPSRPGSSLWLNREGQAEGRFFNCVLTSAFQPIWQLGAEHSGAYEAVVRNVDADDAGLPLWRLLDNAASDDESVELDRLCRMLHAINFFRQRAADGAELFLSVHQRLLSSVSSNHGHAFRRILDALELPAQRVILQLPQVSAQQRWLLGYVTDNYKGNGFRIALTAGAPSDVPALTARTGIAVIKIDAAAIGDDESLARLLVQTSERGARLVVKQVDAARTLARLHAVSTALGLPIHAQGAALGAGQASPPAQLPAAFAARP
jgi:EAL domain-containing protein (putative c-di-GMP-specific phosphodiesterase class I)